MCGIVGYTGQKEAFSILLDGLKRLEYRGYDSAGIAVMDNKQVNAAKAVGEIKNLESKIEDQNMTGDLGIAHTRWATHGVPTENNAHPHIDCSGDIWLVHNGIIENCQKLREQLKREGHEFRSETDTEVAVHLIEKFYNGNIFEALKQALQSKPDIVAPYFKHHQSILDMEMNDKDDYIRAGRKIQEMGAKRVMVPFHCDRILFDENGDVKRPYFVSKISDGDFEVIGSISD